MHSKREDGFRLRSHEISRIEGLSDAVFAFAVTLLIISLEVPRTFTELYQAMRGFLPFAVCFAMLMQIWHSQYTWFRRYGLEDNISVFLNCMLLFLVLFYVYPLKFLFTLLMNGLTGSDNMVRLPNGQVEPMIRSSEGYMMMIIYDGGFIAVFSVFVLLYLYAWRKREQLELNAIERHQTIEKTGAHIVFLAVGLISLATVVIGGAGAVGYAGFEYFLIAPLVTGYYFWMARRSPAARARG